MGRENGWIGRVGLRTVAVTLAVLLGSAELSAQSGASPGVRVEGDARAWEEMTSAWKRLQDLRGYRIRQRNADGTLEMVFELERTAQGRALRIVTTVRHGGQEMRSEMVLVGDQAWQVMSMPGGGSTCRQIPLDRVPPGPFAFPGTGEGRAGHQSPRHSRDRVRVAEQEGGRGRLEGHRYPPRGPGERASRVDDL